MFDVGFWEFLLIGIVALVVVGPERLPEVARSVGRWVGKLRRFVAGVKSDFNAELESGELHKLLGAQKEQIQELRSMVDSTRKEFETSTRDAMSTAQKQFDSAKSSASKSLGSTTSAASAISTDSAGSKAEQPDDGFSDDGAVTEYPQTPSTSASSSQDKSSSDPKTTDDPGP